MTIRRLKTYTGSQGYVYQYYFVGKRTAAQPPMPEYIFDVTSDRKLTYAVSIFLPQLVVAAWAESHGRPSPIPSSMPPSRCVYSAPSMKCKTCRRKAANCRSTWQIAGRIAGVARRGIDRACPCDPRHMYL
jgi:hypothetical protein